jgi:mono/diheme cytochrome c family protein
MPASVRSTTLLIVLATCVPVAANEPTPKFTADQVAFYEKDVKPLLQKHCFKCHGSGEKIKGGLSLASRSATVAGGDTGSVVDFKSPEKSLLLLAVNNKRPDGGDVMPPSGKLPDADIATLTKWVKEQLPVSAADLGKAEAAAPERGNVVTEEAKKYWAYQPVVRPPVPDVRDKSATNPIDAFIRAKLDAKGLTANGPADKVALVRRAYYDLTGLPPTPEQVEAFVKDKSPTAFAKLVDELLASPHYGEKWGRHWLDVVRYAETNGYERDGPKPFAWRFRDYVIRSFNADKPYDQFVREQLAGDELPGESADAIIATGFYRLGLWDDEPADGKQALYDGYDDLVTVAGQGFLAMTLNCARCHDHKKDPIPQADYYKLVAFFRDVRPFSDTRGTMSSTNTTDITAIEQRRGYEGELNQRKAKIADLMKEMVAIEDEAIKTLPAEDQRAAEGIDRPQVVAKLPKHFTEDQRKAYNRLKRERTELENKPLPNQVFALSVNNCDPTPPPVHVLARGNPHAPKEKEVAPPGFPTVLGVPDPAIAPAKRGARTSGRRTVLANWIASKDNPLTARVMVNRVWQHHFGRGIVPSPSDFGKLGEPATHPELLDWLAREFVEPTAGQPWSAAGDAWTLKRMHRLIMTSKAYQMSSAGAEKTLAADPANTLFWRFNMRRLLAEEVRDSILSVSGKLKSEMFGPSVFPKIPQEVLAGQSVPGQGWLKTRGGGYDPQTHEAGNRRSVYASVKRSLQVPILINHDQADTDSSCPVRYTTTVPTQALGMLNSEFTNEMAAAFAARLSKENGDLKQQIDRAIRLTTARVPTDAERQKDAAFVGQLKEKFGLTDEQALARYALLLLNANEFVYLD